MIQGSPSTAARLREHVYEIAEQYTFTATHRLDGMSACHPRHEKHLHRWRVEVVLVSAHLPPVDHPSELVEFEPLRRYLAGQLDCRHLNDVFTEVPTPANVASGIALWCRTNLTGFVAATLFSVTVSIGPNSRARCVLPSFEAG